MTMACEFNSVKWISGNLCFRGSWQRIDESSRAFFAPERAPIEEKKPRKPGYPAELRWEFIELLSLFKIRSKP